MLYNLVMNSYSMSYEDGPELEMTYQAQIETDNKDAIETILYKQFGGYQKCIWRPVGFINATKAFLTRKYWLLRYRLRFGWE